MTIPELITRTGAALDGNVVRLPAGGSIALTEPLDIAGPATLVSDGALPFTFDGQGWVGHAVDAEHPVTLRGLVFRAFATAAHTAAVMLRGNGSSAYRCVFDGNAGCGLGLFAEGLAVRECLIHTNGILGVVGSGANGLVFERCTVMGNFVGGNPPPHAGGMKLTRTRRARIEGNYFNENSWHDLWFDVAGNEDNLVRGNTFARGTGYGLFLELYNARCSVEHNLFIEKDVGVDCFSTNPDRLPEHHTATLIGNVFAGSKDHDVRLRGGDRGPCEGVKAARNQFLSDTLCLFIQGGEKQFVSHLFMDNYFARSWRVARTNWGDRVWTREAFMDEVQVEQDIPVPTHEERRLRDGMLHLANEVEALRRDLLEAQGIIDGLRARSRAAVAALTEEQEEAL